MDETIARTREMLANESMATLHAETRKLAEQFGYDGAADYLQTQLKFLELMREAQKEVFNFDDDPF